MASSTLYIKNLNERINKKRLRDELLRLCEPFGPVVSVHSSRGIKKRGQAFVAFKNQTDAMAALDGLSSREIFSKPMQVALAKTNSDSLKTPEEIDAGQRARNLQKSREATPTSENGPVRDIKSFGDPHSVLLLQNIPDVISLDDLNRICGEFAGFKEARMFAVRHVGFVEFESVDSATQAVGDLANRGIGDITFAKK